MTTIVCDGKTLASDSRITWGSMVEQRLMQKIVVCGDTVYAQCGMEGLLGPLIEWHRAGADTRSLPHIPADCSWEFVVMTRSRTTWYSDKTTMGAPISRQWAIGSGRQFAIGALHAGADAVKAAKIGAKLDIYSGGPIRVIDLKVLKRKTKRKTKRKGGRRG